MKVYVGVYSILKEDIVAPQLVAHPMTEERRGKKAKTKFLYGIRHKTNPVPHLPSHRARDSLRCVTFHNVWGVSTRLPVASDCERP